MENQEKENNNNIDDSDTLEEIEINFAEVKNNFLKSFDENVNQNKEKIKQLSPVFQKMDEIFKKARGINGDIRNIEQIIQMTLEKQHKEYINTFISFMDTVRKELTTKLEEIEKLTEMKKKANDIRMIKCERDFFKSEAIRLNSICKTFKEKIDDLTFNSKLLTDELNSLKIKWKESENINKQLLFELETNLQSQKELEQKFTETQSIINENKRNIEQESKTMNEERNKYENMQEQLLLTQIELKKEKEKVNKTLSHLNKIYLDKNKYEEIFKNCVEETKKIIFNRRAKENKGFKIRNKIGLGKFGYRVNYLTKFENFLPSDKLNTLENFIFNEDVFNMVKEIIFNKPKRNIKNLENTKNIINSYKYYEPDWKIKEIVENANEKGDKILLPKMPLINNGRSNSVINKRDTNINLSGSTMLNKGKMLNTFGKIKKLGSNPKISIDLKIT